MYIRKEDPPIKPQRKTRKSAGYQENCEKIFLLRKLKKFLRVSYKYVWVFLALFGAWSFYLWYTEDSVQQVSNNAANDMYQTTKDLGFVVEYININGIKNANTKQIYTDLPIQQGDAILASSLDEIKQHLKANNWFESVTVKRTLPNTITINVVERIPVAIWQKNHKLHLIDDAGFVIKQLPNNTTLNYPHVIGEDANANAVELLSLLSTQPDLYNKVDVSTRFGNRRWDVKFNNGVEVKLPEKEPYKAWEKLAQLQQDEQILNRNIAVIDMRIADKLFLKLPEAESLGSSNISAFSVLDEGGY